MLKLPSDKSSSFVFIQNRERIIVIRKSIPFSLRHAIKYVYIDVCTVREQTRRRIC